LFEDDFNRGFPGWTVVQPVGFYYDGPLRWQYDIVTGLPNPIVKDSLIEVWDRPGLGVEFVREKAIKYSIMAGGLFQRQQTADVEALVFYERALSMLGKEWATSKENLQF
jgi:hypothetical protein